MFLIGLLYSNLLEYSASLNALFFLLTNKTEYGNLKCFKADYIHVMLK